MPLRTASSRAARSHTSAQTLSTSPPTALTSRAGRSLLRAGFAIDTGDGAYDVESSNPLDVTADSLIERGAIPHVGTDVEHIATDRADLACGLGNIEL